MKLFCNPDSPLAERILVTAIEAGLDDELDVVRVAGARELPDSVSMPQVEPRLETDDGTSVTGVANICAELDSRHPGPKLIPRSGDTRLDILQVEAVADDLLDAALALLHERGDGGSSARVAEGYSERMERALAQLDEVAGSVLVPPVTIGHIAAGCALAWVERHIPGLAWRRDHEVLADWYDGFRQRPSMGAI